MRSTGARCDGQPKKIRREFGRIFLVLQREFDRHRLHMCRTKTMKVDHYTLRRVYPFFFLQMYLVYIDRHIHISISSSYGK